MRSRLLWRLYRCPRIRRPGDDGADFFGDDADFVFAGGFERVGDSAKLLYVDNTSGSIWMLVLKRREL